jgi:putative nucleotidyltransferase with HDIG domain
VEIFLTSLVVAVITALVAEPVRLRAQAFIDRMFFRERYNSTLMLQSLSSSVSNVLDIYKITSMILEEVCSTLHIPLAAFFLRDQTTNRFQLISEVGLETASQIEFRQGHPMILWLASHDQPLTTQDMEVLPQFQSLWRSERLDLEILGAELFIPIKVQEVLIGVFLVGSKRSEQAYTMEDMLTLSTVANQTAVAIENARLYTSEQTRLQEMDTLYSMARKLVTTDNLEDVAAIVAQHAVESVQASYARILTKEEDGDYICRAVHSVSVPVPMGDPSGKEPLVAEHYYDWVLQGDQITVVNQIDPDLHDEEKAILFYNGSNSACLSPLKAVDEHIGLLILGDNGNEGEDAFPSTKLRLINVISDYASSAIQRALLHERLEETFLETIIALANAVDARDSYTGDHSQRMAELSTNIGRVMGLTGDEIEALHWASILHDIGKIGIPDQILNKEGPLTKKEWVIMKEHPVMGAEIVAPVKYLAPVSPLIRAHHEKWDGTGYPYGLEGEDIPLGSRILAVVDAYIAIRDKRVYSEAHTHEEAIAELRRSAGTQFDPYIVDIFCKTITE